MNGLAKDLFGFITYHGSHDRVDEGCNIPLVHDPDALVGCFNDQPVFLLARLERGLCPAPLDVPLLQGFSHLIKRSGKLVYFLHSATHAGTDRQVSFRQPPGRFSERLHFFGDQHRTEKPGHQDCKNSGGGETDKIAPEEAIRADKIEDFWSSSTKIYPTGAMLH